MRVCFCRKLKNDLRSDANHLSGRRFYPPRQNIRRRDKTPKFRKGAAFHLPRRRIARQDSKLCRCVSNMTGRKPRKSPLFGMGASSPRPGGRLRGGPVNGRRDKTPSRRSAAEEGQGVDRAVDAVGGVGAGRRVGPQQQPARHAGGAGRRHVPGGVADE